MLGVCPVVKWYHRGLWILFSWFESMRGNFLQMSGLPRTTSYGKKFSRPWRLSPWSKCQRDRGAPMDIHAVLLLPDERPQVRAVGPGELQRNFAHAASLPEPPPPRHQNCGYAVVSVAGRFVMVTLAKRSAAAKS